MDVVTRGLIGSRVFIMNRTYKDEYGEIKEINGLKKYSEILSFGWPEKEFLKAVGLAKSKEFIQRLA
jgi:hypothetical protein